MHIRIEVPPLSRQNTATASRRIMRSDFVKLASCAAFCVAAGAAMLLIGLWREGFRAGIGVGLGIAGLGVGAAILSAAVGEVRGAVRMQSRHVLDEPCVVELTDETVCHTWASARSERRWTAVEGVFDAGDVWVLRFGPLSFSWLPKRCFTAEQHRDFAAFLNERRLVGV